MSMTQLVIGSALGFVIAQAVFSSIKHCLGWLQRDRAPKGMRTVMPSVFIGVFIKYAALVGASVALITLGVWAVGDYMAAKSARSASANLFDSAAVVPASDSHGSPTETAAPSAPASNVDPSRDIPAPAVDPYADPEFKVRRRTHPVGAPATLKEKFVQQSEAKARTDLLKETQQHLLRSQYDCEAADRAGKYLKAGLDVWGFATWQVKYFPTDSYDGATLPQCREIKNLIDPSQLDLHSTVAQGNHS